MLLQNVLLADTETPQKAHITVIWSATVTTPLKGVTTTQGNVLVVIGVLMDGQAPAASIEVWLSYISMHPRIISLSP